MPHFMSTPRLPNASILDSTVVFNEVIYHPSGDAVDQQEWIDLYNQMAVDVDLSGCHLTSAVGYQFPSARASLVVAIWSSRPIRHGSSSKRASVLRDH